MKTIYCLLSTALALASSTGCVSRALKVDLDDYGEAYAQAQNHQMLLNLARLSEHHPTYFFQLSQINALHEYVGTVTAAGGQSDKSSVVGSATAFTRVPLISWMFGPASATVSDYNEPTFNFVPLNGGDFSAHLLAPLHPDSFNAFFQEGFPVDILMRALIQQVRYAEGTNEAVILNNTPTVENKMNYARFLGLCDILRVLQERGCLLLEPRGTNQTETISEITNSPTAKDVVDGLTQGVKWQREGNVWSLKREATNTLSFQITAQGKGILEDLVKHPKAYMNTNQLHNLEVALEPDSPNGSVAAQVQLKSFLFVLANMAHEEEAFKTLAQDAEFKASVPPFQLRPLLRLDWSGETNALMPPLVKVKYQGKTYQVTDFQPRVGAAYSPTNSYNRDAFSLATTLITQISIDPTKLNYSQQVLQVR